jgi:hypothetical protein
MGMRATFSPASTRTATPPAAVVRTKFSSQAKWYTLALRLVFIYFFAFFLSILRALPPLSYTTNHDAS